MHWDLRMGPRQAGLWAMCSPGSWEAPSPRRAAQQSECSPAALHQHRAHQGNQPSLSEVSPRHTSPCHWPPAALSTAHLHVWHPACLPGAPAPTPRVTQHSSTAPYLHGKSARWHFQTAHPGSTLFQPGGSVLSRSPLAGHTRAQEPHTRRLSIHCSQHTAQLIRLSPALTRKRRNRLLSCPRWALVHWTGISNPQRGQTDCSVLCLFPWPLQTARAWQGRREQSLCEPQATAQSNKSSKINRNPLSQ